MTGDADERLGASLSSLVADVGVALTRVDAIGALRLHRTFRLSFADGLVLKGRRLRSPRRVEIVSRILGRLSMAAFPRVVSHHGDAMLEEWLEGEPLTREGAAFEHLEAAGRLLGVLHDAAVPPDIDAKALDTAGWIRKTIGNLRMLRDRRLITESRCDDLEEIVIETAPPTIRNGIVHRDLCPENLLIDGHGHLASVDNAGVAFSAFDYDLARVWYRWPMTTADVAAFNRGYGERHRESQLGRPSTFWGVAVLSNSARVRLALSDAHAAAAVGRLDAYLADESRPATAGLP